MNSAQAIQYADHILTLSNYRPTEKLGLDNFAQYAEFVASVVREMGQSERARFEKLPEWSRVWRRLYDDFQKIYDADPMVVYRPKHAISRAFHESPAFIRYFRAGNRTSKTQSGYAEHYFHVTGYHPYRKSPAGHTFLVGLEYSKYAPNVFERKMLTGESGNEVSPMFPIGGKWFYHYDDRKKILTVACRDCAEAGKGAACKHPKNTVSLFSDEVGWEQLQGAAYVLGHFDEHVDEGWLDEGQVRVTGNENIKNTSIIITGTPLFGYTSWENRRIAAVVEENDPKLNHIDPNDASSVPLVSLHEVSMRDAGIATKEEVARLVATMDEFAIRARIDGKPAPSTRNPVFDRFILAEMRKACRDPKYVNLIASVPLEEVGNQTQVSAEAIKVTDDKKWTGMRVWEEPDPNGQYIAAVDSARGLSGRDASCCSILRLDHRERRLHLTLVAQFYGWIGGFEYADEVFKASVWYHSAMAVVELTGGFGDAVVLRLKQLGYWNIYREMGKRNYAEFSEDMRFGVDTNAATKPFMVTALKQFVRDRCIHLYCRDTIDEMANFTQEDTTKDGTRRETPKFHGAGGSLDDRVMSLVIGASTAVSTPVFDFQADATTRGATTPATPEWRQAVDKFTESQEEL